MEVIREYVCYKRYRGPCQLEDDVNIPATSRAVLMDNNFIYWIKNDGTQIPICFPTSQVAEMHFARNDDEQGLKRGQYIILIMDLLRDRKGSDPHDSNSLHQRRWNKIWEDESIQKFRKNADEDYWLWNNEFFNAEIEELDYIYKLIKEVK